MIDAYSPYLGYPEGERKRLIAEDAYESFMRQILWEKWYTKRNQLRLLERAVSIVVDDIMLRHDALSMR